jgi:hypothetical protein
MRGSRLLFFAGPARGVGKDHQFPFEIIESFIFPSLPTMDPAFARYRYTGGPTGKDLCSASAVNIPGTSLFSRDMMALKDFFTLKRKTRTRIRVLLQPRQIIRTIKGRKRRPRMKNSNGSWLKQKNCCRSGEKRSRRTNNKKRRMRKRIGWRNSGKIGARSWSKTKK